MEQGRVAIPLIDIGRDDVEIGEALSRAGGTFVPPGAAAFWMGVDAARLLLQQRGSQMPTN